MSLPSVGQLNWGPPLNNEITADETSISANTTNLANHISNLPADPHGDRAFAQALVGTITTGTNGPNGYVILDGSGHIPLSLVPVGAGLTNWIDAIPDYNVPTNGASDASAALNAALAATHANGGGVVYVGNGTFALGNPLIIYPNTWLLSSPGAVYTRITLITAPTEMIKNHATNVVPSGSNIRITGGQWNVASLAHTGVMFSFANAGFILVEDLTVNAYADGLSHVGKLYGCTDVTIDNVQITGSAPLNSGRGSQSVPVFLIEELNSTNLPNLPNVTYSFQECIDIRIRGCKLRAGILSDSSGPYTAWTSFCGTQGTIVSGQLHQNINIVDGNFSTGFATAAIEVKNWSNVTVTGNQFTYPTSVYTTTWIGVTAQLSTFLFDYNAPRCFPPTTTAVVVSTSVETTIAQYTLPANDWRKGTSCYRHRHSGIIRTATNSETIRIRVYVGTAGNNTDTLCEDITVSLNVQVTDVPYVIEHRGFDIDSDGHWNPCGVSFKSTAITTISAETISSTRPSPTAGVQLFVTHTITWGTGKSNNRHECRTGFHERVIV